MQIIKGGFNFVEFDSVSTFTAPKKIEKLLKAGTMFTPKSFTEEFADGKMGSAAKGVDVSIRSANVDNGVAAPYTLLKAAEDAQTELYFRFVKMLDESFSISTAETDWSELVGTDITSSIDAADFKQGSGSVQLVAGDVIPAATILATKVISKDLTGYKAVLLWVKSLIAHSRGDLALLLDNTALCASPLETLPLPELAADTWTEVTLVLKDPTALAALISIGLKSISGLANGETIHIDDVRGVTGVVTVINKVIPKVDFEANESGKHNAIKIIGEGFADSETNLLTTNF